MGGRIVSCDFEHLVLVTLQLLALYSVLRNLTVHIIPAPFLSENPPSIVEAFCKK
jgi:hypothetical protein